MITACLIFYNEDQFLQEWCERVVPFVDRVIAVDGCIEGFPSESPCSTDNSYKILSSFPTVEVFAKDEIWPDECVKRSAYLAGSKGDWYVAIDADEMLVGGENLREEIDRLDKKNEDFGRLECRGYGADRAVGRVYRHQKGLHFLNRHFWLAVDDRVVWKGDDGFILDSLYLLHRKDERTPQRLKAKALFQTKQAQRESPWDR
jgi:hypothetical protein